MALDKTIFKDKTLSDLLEEIHNNSSSTRNQVSSLIAELKPLIENIGDATLVVPMIKEYMEIGVKNDEHLIKMAAIIQRIESAANKGDGADFFDPSELADLLEASELTEVEDKAKPEEEENNE
jgi:predicted PilT family ATPase|tara:strand:+ start:176 stop:544 length:369 start_codon:yes stop_codon:yes gene_type:complete